MELHLYIFLFFLYGASAIRMHVPLNGLRCLKDEVFRHVIVTGDYEVIPRVGTTVSLEVLDRDKHVLYTKSEITKGKFSFSVENFNIFDVCFTTQSNDRGGDPIEVSIELKHGEESKNYEVFGQAEQLKPLELELKKLEDMTKGIVKDFVAMHQRTSSIRNTNESTHQRVLWFSIISMASLVILACWQVLYLRKYFKSKKLIE